jgi:hypothetical protein
MATKTARDMAREMAKFVLYGHLAAFGHPEL